ncbi:MAG: Fic family protein [Saprospiraceae bacterium]|nr:Fic family protein [Saprospiraceae bacterium]
MSKITDRLTQVEALRRQIESHGKLPDETLRRIEYRFRLECNYYSNRQEGGTLTRQETRTVMTGIITIEGKPLSDVREMQGHDKTMLEIMRIGQSELSISEKRIKDIHHAIVVEEDSVTQKQVGEWKKEPNEIINWKGEKFGFTPPAEVPEAMRQLLNWLNGKLEKVKRGDKNAIHPAVLAFEFHHRFLTIHPFHDGNGRTARLLSNLILVANGYPLFYITDEEKETYNRYLADIQGYGSAPDLFVELMLGLLERSLRLTLDVVEGRDVEEDDWEKRLSLLTTELAVEPSLQKIRSKETLLEVAGKVVFPVLEVLRPVFAKFDKLFLNRKIWFGAGSGLVLVEGIESMRQVLDNSLRDDTEGMSIVIHFEGFTKAPRHPFDIRFGIKWQFLPYDYSFYLPAESGLPQFNRPYHKYYSPEEIKDTSNQTGTYLTDLMEKKIREQQNPSA